MVNDSAATESLLKHIKPLWIFPALILTACGVEPRLPGPVVREEVGNFGDLPQFDRVPQQVLDFQQVSNFDRSAYNGPLGIDSAIDTSDVIEELRGSRINFVARYYRDPTSSLPALSSQEARAGLTWFEDCCSLGAEFARPRKSFLLFWYSDAFSAYKQAKAIGQPAGSAIYFAIDFNAHELEPAKEYFRGIAASLTAASGGRAEYQVGVYGSGAVCDAIKRAGLARYSWLTNATSWDGSLDYNDWNIRQGEALPFSFDNDSDEVRGDYGGFRLREF